MAEIAKIKSFLDSVDYEEKRCQCLDMQKGMNPFVTISRQAGAGGRALAKAILEEISKSGKSPLFEGWQMIDDEICEMVCSEPGLKVSVRRLIESEYTSEIEDMLSELIVGDSPRDVVLKRMFKIIRTLATHGKVIVVGRGGVCLTRNLPLGIHLRLVASLESRIKRMMKLLNLTEKKARESIQEQDRARSRLMKVYFNKNIDDPLLYDTVWNTDTVPIEEIARAVVNLIEARACHCLARH